MTPYSKYLYRDVTAKIKMKAGDLKVILDGTDPGTRVHVPDELLAFWFPPGVKGGRLDSRSLDAIMLVANQSSCVFEYLTQDESGCFTKLARC